MAVFNFENIWQVMKNYNFQTVTDIDNEMLCVICKNLLINAHITPCGCRFCFACISDYLNKNVKHCPGNTEDCQLELISLNTNIFADNSANIKISKINVKCPLNSCEFNDELRKMSDHLQMCNYRSVDCPFINIGCNKCEISHDKMSNHFQSEILIHTKLLLDFVDNVNNKINTLQANNIELKDENEKLKSEINTVKLDCESRQQEIDQLKADKICVKNDNISIRENIDKLILYGERNQIIIADLQIKCNKILNEDIVKLRNIDSNMREDFNERKLNAERQQKEIREFETKCQNIENGFVNANQQIEKEKNLIRKIDEKMQNVDKRLLQVEINENRLNYGEFVWKIEKFSDKMADVKKGINRDIYSESFLTHKNGYKMCLHVYPDGYGDGKGTHLSVYFCLIKGDFDDILEWPFKHAITLELINQQTRIAHVSKTVKYEDKYRTNTYNKPKDRNIGFGYENFLSLTELSTNPNLIKNDQIFIKCTVKILL